jgi:hypothetical protein
MKKLIIGIIALGIFKVGTLSAHVITVSNNAVNAGQYTNLQTAVNAANAGDTVYVMGSPTDYLSVTISKPRITLMGAGYNVTGLQNNYNSVVDYVYLNGSVNGVKIQGLYIGSNIQQTGASVTVDSVDVERCFVSSSVYIYGQHWTIRNNNLDNVIIQNNANVYIQNNFIEDIQNTNQLTVYVDHNIFATYGGNALYTGISNAQITNNVFYYSSPENSSGCTFKNNICSAGSAYDLNTYAGNTESGNIYANPPGWTDATIPASTVCQTCVWSYKWTFTAASPAHLAATDGSDIGVYGGLYPMPNLNGFTHIPQIVSMSATGIVAQGGNLNLSFKGQGIMAHGVVKGEYFFDNDPGLGSGTAIALTAGDSASIVNLAISVGVLKGIHVIGVRVKDSIGHWSLYEAQNFYVQPNVTLSAPPQIVAAEYFFDNDPGQGLGKPIPTGAAADSVNINTSESVASLTPGYHNMFIRTQNANGQWSLYEGRNFYIQPTVVLPAVSKVVSAEYFYDNDPGQGLGTSIITGAAADSVNINTTEPVGSLTPGYHSMFVRTQNALGEWSLYEGRNFFVSNPVVIPPPPAKIVAAEYFFDNDPGQGLGTAIAVTKGDSVNINKGLSIGSLSAGFHNIFIRTKDSTGRWSLYEGRNFYVQPAVVVTKPSRIVASEYYFDYDPYNMSTSYYGVGNGTTIGGVITGDSIKTTKLLNASALSLGAHNILIRVKDSTGVWSLYEDRAFTVKACTIATSAKVISNASCNGSNNGVATALPSKGSPPYTYSWSTAVKQTTDTATGLTAGTYTVIVSDTTGCSAVDSVTIKQPAKILVSIKSVTNTTCDSANGKATVLASGGKGGIYTYSWNTLPVQTGNSASKLSAGAYAVTVLDSGCVAVDTVKIAPSTLPSILITSKPSKCGDSIGSATATVSLGTAPYKYVWTNGDTLNFDNGLKAGTYQVTVHDKNGCMNIASVIINNSNGPIISLVGQQNISCSGKSDGLLAISVSGGASPYSYAWSNGATTSQISSLPTGPYVVTATDKTGCFSDTSFYVSAPAPLSLTTTTTNSGCSVSTGSATVAVSGGTSPFTYAWNDGTTSSTAPALSAGTYRVAIADAHGCVDTAYAAVSNTSGPLVTITSLTNATCSTGTDGIVVTSSTGGTGAYTYAWSTGGSTDSLHAPSGNYNLTVTDGLGCVGSITVNIPDNPPVAPPICFVTVDTSNKNMVIWDKITTKHIKTFNIYRETTVTGVFTLAATVPYDSLSVWVDPVAKPGVRSYRYELSQVDSCGNESPMSVIHKTIHMTANVGLSGLVNLIWDNYEGLPFIQYIVFRDTIYGQYHRYDSISASSYTYTDISPLTTKKPVYYAMGINTVTCTPHTHAKTYNSSHSNTANVIIQNVGIAAINAEASSLNIYPNPTRGVFNVSLSLASGNQNVKIKVFNAMGQLILTENCSKTAGAVNKQIDLSNYSKGVYVVQVISDANSMYRRVIIE